MTPRTSTKTGSITRRLIHLPIGAAVLASGLALAQGARLTPGVQPDGTILTTTHQLMKPVGKVQLLEGARPKDLSVSADGSQIAVLCTSRIQILNTDGTPVQDINFSAAALGIAFAPSGKRLYASRGDGKITVLEPGAKGWAITAEWVADDGSRNGDRRGRGAGNPQAGGLAVSKDGASLFVALGIRNSVAQIDTASGKIVGSVPVGVSPYHVELSPDGRTLAVANRGGKEADAKEPWADSAGSRVRVDPRTDAANNGSVTLLSTQPLASPYHIDVARQPGGMCFDRSGRRLIVTSSDSDEVHVVDVRRKRPVRTLSLAPPGDSSFGQMPTDAIFSGDGKRLFVSCGGANAVAVLDLEAKNPVLGFLPAAWYPIAVDRAGDRLLVASSKGIGPRRTSRNNAFGVHNSVGALQVVEPTVLTDLPAYTRRVAEWNQWGAEPKPRENAAPRPIPERVGEPSLFKHVVYIIKENQTYDFVFGDMREGNGDPKLAAFGEEVTPNHHALARQFVLLDNTFTSGTNSADGHQWVASSLANAYSEHNYGHHARSYPYDGGDPLAYSPTGFLWTAAAQAGRSVRVYGEWVNNPSVKDPVTGRTPSWSQLWADYKRGGKGYRITAETDNAALRPFLHPNFIGFPSIVSDQWRADQYLAELARWEKEGGMPQLSIMLLPNDHTAGTRPGMPTPRAAVADNDLALGRVVEGISRSKFWRNTLILVIEDDSQFGVDHVDGHRTVAMCISPYTRRGAVVSEMYDHTSFARTIGLVLGVQPMNRFDKTGRPLHACFTDRPDFRGYTTVPNRIPIDEMNAPARTLFGEARKWALASQRLDLSDVDRADAGVVARAAWHSRFPTRRFPAEHFNPPSEDEDGDD